MNLNEEVNKLYNQFLEYNKDKMEEVINHIKNCKDSFSITVRNRNALAMLDYLKDIRDGKEPDFNINLEENGISIPLSFLKFYDVIKDYIPKTIKSFKMNYIDDNYEFLSEFPNLEEIEVAKINNEDLQFLGNKTNIKTINGFFYLRGINIPNSANNGNKVYYKDIVINNNSDYIDGTIDVNVNDIKNIKSLLDHFDLKDYKTIRIKTNSGESTVELKETNVVIKMVDPSFNNATLLYETITGLGFNVDTIKMVVSDDHKEDNFKYTEFDFTELDELSKKTNLTISYDSSFVRESTYDEFRNLTEAIKWYHSLLNNYPLSPLEKLTYAYDIMKSFEYTKEKGDASESRYPSKIISGNSIVCAGYTALLSEIIKGIDDNIKIGAFGVNCYKEDKKTLRGGHSRSIVRIDDDKYNVHGFYILDPTWDSYKKEGYEKYGNDYISLDLYQYFLIPITDYEIIFPYDSEPNFFNKNHSSLNENLSEENVEKEIESLNNERIKKGKFSSNSVGVEKLLSYNFPSELIKEGESIHTFVDNFKGRRIEFDEFLSLVRNVRKAEGFNEAFLDGAVDRVARINGQFFGVNESVNEKHI